MDLQGTIVSLDGVYDCRANRKAIFNRGMVPNINPNPRGGKRRSEAASRSSNPPSSKSASRRSSVCSPGKTNSGACFFASTHQRGALRVQDPRLYDGKSSPLLPELIFLRWLDFIPARREPACPLQAQNRPERHRSFLYAANRVPDSRIISKSSYAPRAAPLGRVARGNFPLGLPRNRT